jgi:hypothetical protein
MREGLEAEISRLQKETIQLQQDNMESDLMALSDRTAALL